IPAWPFGENFRNDRIEPGLEIRPGAVQDVVLDAVRISQADQPPSRPAYRSTEQQRYRRARFLIGIKTDFCPGGGFGARPQIKPLGQGEKAVVGGRIKQALETARQSSEIRISVQWHQAMLVSSHLVHGGRRLASHESTVYFGVTRHAVRPRALAVDEL